jgi:hypothetical protein
MLGYSIRKDDLCVAALTKENLLIHHHHHQWLYSPCKDLGHLTYGDSLILLRHTIGLLWMSDQHATKASTYTDNITHKHKRQMSMPSAGFEPAIPAIKRPQTYALDHADTGIGKPAYQ